MIRDELHTSVNALIDEEEQLFGRSAAGAQREAALAQLGDALDRVTEGRARLKEMTSLGTPENT